MSVKQLLENLEPGNSPWDLTHRNDLDCNLAAWAEALRLDPTNASMFARLSSIVNQRMKIRSQWQSILKQLGIPDNRCPTTKPKPLQDPKRFGDFLPRPKVW